MLKYWLSFGLQSTGAFILLWKGVPIYRSLLSGTVSSGNQSWFWALLILALIQPAFWTTRRVKPPIITKDITKTVLGHVIVFLGRLVFVFVGGLFSAIFYMGYAQIHLASGFFLLMALLFSMFCYTLELEKLGRGLINEN